MGWKVCAFLVLMIAVVGGSIVVSRDAPGRGDSRASYRRPAAIPYPDDNPYTAAKAELGRTLFFDPILSGGRTRSCGTCHNPSLSWGDGLPRAVGEGNIALPLRSPTLLAIAWIPRLGWDGKFRDLESVTFGPITSPANMNLSEPALMKRLQAIPDYVSAFETAFGPDGITRRNVELALATFQRSIVVDQTPFDSWVGGNERAIGAAAKRGFELFNGKARCSGCHNGFAFSDGSFHDIGTATHADVGRGRLFPTSVKLRYAFKTPTLRDVARRAPYMHDGSIPTLAGVIDLYDRGGIERPSRSVLIRPLELTQAEKTDLIEFLNTLTAPPRATSHLVPPR